MLFNSIEFLIFFPLVTGLYFLLPHRYRWLLLLSASCVFYMFFVPVYILILLITIIIDYAAAIYIEQGPPRLKKRILWISIVSTCIVLFVFKYYNFFIGSVSGLAAFLGLNYSAHVLNIILPIGLSFHTFQSLSYVIEVYRGNQKAERHFGIYSLYVMFYPQLVAGPIERPQNLLHQFREEHHFDYARFASGIRLMAWGMLKKVAIADRLSLLVNAVYDQPEQYSGLQFVIATVFFAFQIYCDFSGYSDIARGCARVMGFELMKNFNAPYLSRSVSEFWSRWHISLSTWFKDYLYIPMGGNRVSKPKVYRNLLVTFSVSGLWHGANWTYVVWGALNGCYLVIENMIKGPVKKIRSESFLKGLLATLLTFSLICISWVFFRAKNMHDAWYILGHMPQLSFSRFHPGLSALEFSVAVAFILLLLAVELLDSKRSVVSRLNRWPGVGRWALYYSLFFVIIFFGVFNKTQFIYFQF